MCEKGRYIWLYWSFNGSISSAMPRTTLSVMNFAYTLSSLAYSLLLQDAALPLHFLGAVFEVVGDEV